MANLLKCWPVLTRKERRTITFALRNHPPSSKYLINNGEWLAAADNPNPGFLDRQVAITALHHINGVYGTAAALAIAHKLQEPCVRQSRDGAVP